MIILYREEKIVYNNLQEAPMENFSTLSFRKMQLEDVFTFRNWGRHDSILFLEYNFLEEREKDIIDWYKWKSNRSIFRILCSSFRRKNYWISFFKKI